MIDLFSTDATTPGKAITTYVSWADIAAALGIDEQWELLSQDNVPGWVRKAAFREVESYSSPHTTAEKRLALESQIIDSIIEHWSPANVIPNHLDFEQLLGNINTWSWQDPKNKDIFGKPPVSGIGIQWVDEEDGLQLTIYPPFEIPYVESYYQIYRNLPELNMDELSGYEVIETCYFVEEALGSSIKIDLSQWDEQRPRLYDLINV